MHPPLLQFRKPSVSRYIKIFSRDGVEVFSIDVSVSEYVIYPEVSSSRVLTFIVADTPFIPGMTYYVLMDPGAF